MLLAALLSATDAAIVTDAGTYGTSNNLTKSQAVSTKVKEIVDLIIPIAGTPIALPPQRLERWCFRGGGCVPPQFESV